MPAFWHWFVVGLTVLFIIYCVWLVSWSAKQGPKDVADDDLVGHKWDGDLEEWNNPAPKWWLYLYFITIAWGIGFLVAYPGLGNYQGMLGWTSTGQYEQEMQYAAATYEPIYEEFAAMDFAELTQNQEALSLGKSLYASYCTTCHGSDARGAPGYPNLADNDWQWGSDEQDIVTTILNGRMAAMPVLAPALGGDAGVDNMAKYVKSLSTGEADAGAQSAQPMFVALCSACHGVDGKGNKIFGAPNLTDDIWLYGSSHETIRDTLLNGRNGQMPAHGEMLGANRTKILAAYVASLSQQ
ncbi:MAG: cytochrome-c oxidase, cbb3-type subunit III [Gammaproteobacteria bacterium]|nr:cytochrome-c oxidase, cbb3-type subunit III [Gammaproteobacteria bacterium]NNF50752.1 cytochrome-c oxidase, cbb3-type subunit III [Woeseiaceae bacterium]